MLMQRRTECDSDSRQMVGAAATRVLGPFTRTGATTTSEGVGMKRVLSVLGLILLLATTTVVLPGRSIHAAAEKVVAAPPNTDPTSTETTTNTTPPATTTAPPSTAPDHRAAVDRAPSTEPPTTAAPTTAPPTAPAAVPSAGHWGLVTEVQRSSVSKRRSTATGPRTSPSTASTDRPRRTPSAGSRTPSDFRPPASPIQRPCSDTESGAARLGRPRRPSGTADCSRRLHSQSHARAAA